MSLAAGLGPDPLGELERSPRLPSRNWGAHFYGGGKGMGKGKERGGRKGRVGEGRLASYTIFRPCPPYTIALAVASNPCQGPALTNAGSVYNRIISSLNRKLYRPVQTSSPEPVEHRPTQFRCSQSSRDADARDQ